MEGDTVTALKQSPAGISAVDRIKQEALDEQIPEISPRTGKPKRRKAVRACIHCQRTHLTCDNNRPCERCVSRGFADTCRDGTRKKAKYLGNDDLQKTSTRQRTSSRRQQTQSPMISAAVVPSMGPPITPAITTVPPVPAVQPQIQAPIQAPVPAQILPTQDMYLQQPAAAAAPQGYYRKNLFQSSVADSEYNILSSILQTEGNETSPFSDHSLDGQFPLSGTGLDNAYTLDNFNINGLIDVTDENSPTNDWLQPPRPPPVALTINQPWDSPQFRPDPSQVYHSVLQPFPYTPGFHTLFAYLKSRFGKDDLMEIVKSMAKYRPSFIAYASRLTQEDLVFLEQCFQRSLLEYEQYFSYSGTPTIIWRRTGQIAAVGPEFCMLTGYEMGELLPKDNSTGKFIIELMDDQSTINYFRTFSEIAFGDHRGVRMSRCVLVTKSGQSVRAASVLTLKRDMFGIPMLIIGNFLPILQK